MDLIRNNTLIEFILWFCAAQLFLTAAQLPLRKKKIKPWQRVCLIVSKALVAVVLAVLVLAGPVQLRFAQPFMMALYVALFADAAADTLYSIVQVLRKKERSFIPVKIISLLFGAAFFVYGVCNMFTVTPQYHTYTSSKLTKDHTVVFIADLHVGSAQPFSITQKTIDGIKALHPDATILGGDIVDDYTTKEEMNALFGLFADFDTPVYYIYGNHDRQGHAQYAGGRKFTPEELEQAITENGIVILKDEFARLDEIVLLGREDLSEKDGRADINTLNNPDASAYLIVADHQPNDFKKHAAFGADLQLSGHTHAGQLFPLRMMYQLIGYCYGDYHQDSSVMNVSAGACGWRMPLRTDAGCHYEVIRLVPLNNENR